MTMFEPDEEEDPRAAVRAQGPMAEPVDPAASHEPEAVVRRRMQEDEFLSREQDWTAPASPEQGYDQPAAVARPAMKLSPAQQEWLDLMGNMGPGVLAVLRRKPPELEAMLKWLCSVQNTERSKPLLLSIPSINCTLEVPCLSMSRGQEGTLVCLLAAGAPGLRMPMGSSILWRNVTEGSSTWDEAIFVGCFDLPGFPFRFLLLGLPATMSPDTGLD